LSLVRFWASTFKSAAFRITASSMAPAILPLPAGPLRDKTPPSAHLAAHHTRTAMTQSDTRPATYRSGLQPARERVRNDRRRSAGGAAAGPAWSQSDPVIAKVNGIEIHESDLAMAEEDVGQNPQTQQLSGDAKRDYLVSYLADVIWRQRRRRKEARDQKEFKSASPSSATSF